MREQEFRAWLAVGPRSPGTVDTQVSKVRKIEAHFGDLDALIASGEVEKIAQALVKPEQAPEALGAVAERRHLKQALRYYRAFAAAESGAFDSGALQDLKQRFLGAYPDFESSGGFPGSSGYHRDEDDYKRALIARAAELVTEHRDDEQALGGALLDLATGKTEYESNLVSWRMIRGLEERREAHPGLLEQAAARIALASAPDDAILTFVEDTWDVAFANSADNPYADSRLLPTLIAALTHPIDAIALRTDRFQALSKALLGQRLFGYNPLSADELAIARDLSQRLFAIMRDEWGWQPRDLWDVQGFVWVALGKGADPVDLGNGPYWFVGASFGRTEDQVDRFLADGIWMVDNPTDRQREQTLRMKPSDRIAIKSTYIRRHDLPFANNGRRVSVMAIKATGFISANPGDGERVEVAWDPPFEPREWYHYTYQPTIWEVFPTEEMARRLIRFAFLGEKQDYAWFLANLRNWQDLDPEELDEVEPSTPITFDPVNLILYGPPGTGKTWRTVAEAVRLCGEYPDDDPLLTDPDRRNELRGEYESLLGTGRIDFVTFHQNYGYEDFVEGLRPKALQTGGFTLEPTAGIFRRIVDAATKTPDGHVLIIDEINRANVSKVFGELITLLEPDKRIGMPNEIRLRLPYSPEKRFGVPANLHIIGTMNTADRSIALLDTALRRRFRFEEIAPDPGLLRETVDRVPLRKVLEVMNERIEYLHDREHRIGHAFFMGEGGGSRAAIDATMRDKVIPLLQEYFFDDWSRIAAVVGKGFIKKDELPVPPGIPAGEERFSWSVRPKFAEDAYDTLIGA